ncbi:endonuclease/exonuclease/phosphatase family protein [Gregarina niphandrodes]|uniref:Endonuclease/exonuclease/phosphatase family protein n=1 Tax=Gregarina niphandrodes TaxID=110365 RepID=A0A023B7M9_GRENI|nr:endonuclease/exonuclease/phosphatase family protein [Gregarina niphandrodes]EZG67521.1 endonuclease/exonuclease/phosphatase family protein [Gregarina niphandrodes]|eukprot:XP_011130218.1 endonuclease/exonuclease/phosphatase family protein [Gregarina niphandrodes]
MIAPAVAATDLPTCAPIGLCLVSQDIEVMELQFYQPVEKYGIQKSVVLKRKLKEPCSQCFGRLRLKLGKYAGVLSATGQNGQILYADAVPGETNELCPQLDVLMSECEEIRTEIASWKVIQNVVPPGVTFSIPQCLFRNHPAIVCTPYYSHMHDLVAEWYCLSREETLKLYPPELGNRLPKTIDVRLPQYSSTVKLGERDPSEFGRLVGTGLIWDVAKDLAIGSNIVVKIKPREDLGIDSWFGITICDHTVLDDPPRSEWVEDRLRSIIPRVVNGDHTIRVCSWNILAPVYAATSFAKEEMFPFCAEEAISYDYRKPLIARHLGLMKADVFCFQEVGVEVFHSLLVPYLDGHEGRFFEKKSKAEEGLAIFVRRDRFRICEQQLFTFKKQFVTNPEYRDICESCDRLWGGDFTGRVLERMSSVVGALRVIDTVTKRDMVIVNSHFYWHPMGSHIRALQAYFAVNEALKMTKERGSLIVAGDMNADNGTAAIDLLQKGYVGPNHPSWAQAVSFKYGGFSASEDNGLPAETSDPTFLPQGPALALPKDRLLASAQLEPLEFTNNIGVFKAVLDWIFSTEESLWSLKGVPVTTIDTHDPSSFSQRSHTAFGRIKNSEKMTGAVAAYYASKIEQLRQVIAEKMSETRRLEAQRNELNLKVRELKEEVSGLLEPASHIGEVVKPMGKEKVLVKVSRTGWVYTP